MSTPELKPNMIIADRYILKKYIGSGSFGEVWEAEDSELAIDVAIKLYISLDQSGQSEFKDEYKVAYGLSHENLLTAQYYGVWEHRPYLIMKYCENGNASALAGKADEATIWRFIHDVSAGLRYLHSQEPPIVHQDIKPENILRDDRGRFLITDFGISHKMRNTMRKQSQRVRSSGAIPYMGPERFAANPVTVNASDIWSLGVSAYELATGDLPFMGQGGAMLKAGAEIPNIDIDKFSKDLNYVIRACMAKEPWDRPTAEYLEKYTAARLAGDKTPWEAATEQSQSTVRTDNEKTIREGGDIGATIPAGTVPQRKTPSAKEVVENEMKIGKSKKMMIVSIIAAVIVIAVGAGAAWYFIFENDKKTKVADEDAAPVVALFDKLVASTSRDIAVATNDEYEPLLSAASRIDSLGVLIDDNRFMKDSVTAVERLVAAYNDKAEPAIDAWLRAANTQYEVAEDLPAAIEYYNIASSLYLCVPDCISVSSETTNRAYEAISALEAATQCPAVYMAVTKCGLSADGRSVEVEYNGLTTRMINGVSIHYVLYDRTTGDVTQPLDQGDAVVSIEPGVGHKLVIDVPEGTAASAISMSAAGKVFYNTKP